MTFSNSPSPGVTLQGGGGSGGGGGGTPGGSSGQVQYNNAGAFGGMSGTAWNDTNRALTITGATLTADAPVLDLTQTWSNAAVTFTGIKLNATSTASAAASLLMDLQLGTASKFSVSKVGVASVPNTGANGSTGYALNNSLALVQIGSLPTLAAFSSEGIGFGPSGITSGSSLWSRINAAGLGFYNGAGTVDATIGRRGTANLNLGAADAAAPVAQILSVQSVVAGTANTAGAAFTITGSQGTGSGAGGSIIFQVAGTGAAPTVQNTLVAALTIAGTGICTFANTIKVDGAATTAFNYSDVVVISGPGSSTAIKLNDSGSIGFTSGFATGTLDTILRRDDADKLALRRTTNAQEFRVYNTFTSSTNFERFRIFAQAAAAVLIGTEKGSAGGTARALEIQTDATSRLTLDTVGSARIVTALTVATLPGTPLTGMMARVTDALAPAVGVTVAAGGAAQALCWYNGANWTVIGV